MVVVWKFSISGTGKWHGKNMRKVKQRAQPAGAENKIVFLWAGSNSSELDLGEAALLATDLR